MKDNPVKQITDNLASHFNRWLFFRVLIVLASLFVLFGLYSILFNGKIYAHATVAGINIGLKSKSDAAVILKQKTDDFLKTPIALNLDNSNKSYSINLAEIGLNFDVNGVVDSAWSYGHRNRAWLSFLEQFKSIFAKNRVPVEYTFNDENLNQKIASISAELDQPEKDFTFNYENGQFVLVGDRKSGSRIDRDLIKSEILAKIDDLSHSQLNFKINEYKPTVSEEKANDRLLEANKILNTGDLTLKSESQDYKLDVDTIGGLIKTKVNGDDLALVFNDDRLNLFVKNIAATIDIAPVNAKLSIADSKAVVFQASQNGKTLNQTQTASDIKSVLLSRISVTGDAAKTLTLKIDTQKPEISDADVNNLGIKELVGTATTSFANSPANRIHNIQIGAAALNGIILKPGEEFSTLAHLGTIDGSTGYLPELVIKDNNTVPEFGGGLCQVSSTLFRAALNAGMTITERQNHSYRVSYYEPPIGMDATIYDPAPDFKFLNTFASNILVQSKINGTKITFELYGTKDGRVITMSTPVAYDYVSPPDPVMTPTDTLPVGQTQLVSHSHQGASASFDYKVTAADGKVLQSKTFVSKYVALPEKWLVGAAAASSPTPNCTDGAQNGDETGIDCGGSCPNACQP